LKCDAVTRSADLHTASRLIVGLGSENVLETGIRLHHTYGLPLIPGSALKGLASHFCDTVWGQRHLGDLAKDENKAFRRDVPDKAPRYHELLFGTTDDGGIITFHDAWILPDSLADRGLSLDVMTPHHPKWQTNQAPPTDFVSPVPVSFLSVSGTFRVAVSWVGPAEHPSAQDWTELAFQLLKASLADWGVGGKTSSGYGQLVETRRGKLDQREITGGESGPRTVPSPGSRVEAALLAEKTKKGGWRAKHEPSGLAGPIQNPGDVPAGKNPGDVLSLIVASASEREIAFRFPTAADDQRAKKPPSKPTGRQGR
jgi:CRISPR type III-B/RAMP module RAMP protein Cmr6